MPAIQGGCLGITRPVAEQFYASGFFLDPALTACPPPWAIVKPLLHRPVVLGLTSIDWTVGWAAKTMHIELIDWPEIMSEWQLVPENDDLRYAITHPHKLADAQPPEARPSSIRSAQGVVSATGHQIPA